MFPAALSRDQVSVYGVGALMTERRPGWLPALCTRLTLNAEHLADLQSRAADFAKRADDSFSVGFREEGTRVQDGFCSTFENKVTIKMWAEFQTKRGESSFGLT